VSDELSRRSHELLKHAADLDPSERAAFVDIACAGDTRLRHRVRALVAALDSSPSFLEAPALGAPTATALPPATPGGWIGGYRVVRVIGSGGMASVYEALQDQPRRRVALKVMRHGLRHTSALRRFEFETEVLARLRHPGIAQIFEAGTHHEPGADPVPFFAMEFVEDARTITSYAAEQALDMTARLRMFVDVCEAVQHGHLRGVIHRDLKPGNILVGRDGRAKVIDFGVARSSELRSVELRSSGSGAGSLSGTSLRPMGEPTEFGQLIGTLNYMSPEQCAGAAIDIRSDVYAMGVVLFELLCDRLPIDVSTKPLPAALRSIELDSPPRPSAFKAECRGDLDAIVGKALEKSPDRRYQTVADLAGDIRRMLDGLPIEARGATTIYRLGKFARRHRAIVLGASGVFVSLVLGIVATARQAQIAERARAEAAAGLARALEAEALAEVARDQERQQRVLAEQRERDIEQVARFQSLQLRGVKPGVMGAGLRSDVESRARAALIAGGASAEAADAEVRELSERLARVNFTDVALESLGTNIFDRAVAAAEQEFVDQPLVRARLLHATALTMNALGLFGRAEPTIESALSIRRETLGTDHAETLDSLATLAGVLVNRGAYARAIELYREASEGRRRLLGAGHPDTLSSLSGLAATLVQQGKLSDAEPVFREVLEGRRLAQGDLHPDTLRAVANMCTVLQDLGRFDEAAPYCHEALDKRRATLGDEDAGTLISVDAMGSLLLGQGDLAGAEACYREAYETRRRVLGSEHMQTLRSINNLAATLTTLGRHEEAEPLYREALATRERVLGREHPDTMRAIGNMASALRAAGRLDEAEPYYVRSLEVRRRVLGDDHPATLHAMDTMATFLQDRGDLEGAEALLREAVDRSRRALGEDHPDALPLISHLGSVLRDRGQLDEADALGEAAVLRARAAYPRGHWNTARYLADHARTRMAQGRVAEAEQMLLEAHGLAEGLLGAGHERTRSVARDLAEAYRRMDAAEPGRGHAERAETWATRSEAGNAEAGAH
jgi:eukaryotic-like serine/threonine-protein kinase